MKKKWPLDRITSKLVLSKMVKQVKLIFVAPKSFFVSNLLSHRHSNCQYQVSLLDGPSDIPQRAIHYHPQFLKWSHHPSNFPPETRDPQDLPYLTLNTSAGSAGFVYCVQSQFVVNSPRVLGTFPTLTTEVLHPRSSLSSRQTWMVCQDCLHFKNRNACVLGTPLPNGMVVHPPCYHPFTSTPTSPLNGCNSVSDSTLPLLQSSVHTWNKNLCGFCFT